MEAMQHQGALRQAGTFVAQHCAGNCTAARQSHNTEIRPLIAEEGASMQGHAGLPQHWWSVKECGARMLSYALLLSSLQEGDSSPAPSSQTLQDGTH